MENDVYPSPWVTGFRGKCPRCGEGRLYRSFLKVNDRCSFCGLELSRNDAGDGAVPFVILQVGAICVGIGAWIVVAFNPPIWVPIVIVCPIVVILTAVIMPRAKGLLIALQFVNKAGDTGDDSFDRPED